MGSPIIDDFGHHPTAIRETLSGLRDRYPSRDFGRFSSRGRTLPVALSFNMSFRSALLRLTVSFFRVSRESSKFPKENDSTPNASSQISLAAGKPAFYEPTADHIIEKLAPLASRATSSSSLAMAGLTGSTTNFSSASRKNRGSHLLRQTPVFRMSLQNMRDVTANRNNSQVLLTRNRGRKARPFRRAVSSKLRRYLRMGKYHSVAFPVIFGDR